MKKIFIIVCILNIFLFSKEITLTLDQAIKLALENNGLSKISKLKFDISKAQYEQALSANYPSLDAVVYATRDKSDLVFQQRASFIVDPEILNIFANIMGNYNPAGALSTQAQTATANPEIRMRSDIDTVAQGRDTIIGKLQLNYPLYTGGKISAIIEQAKLNKSLANQAIIRDDNSIVYDVKKYYYAYMLTSELYALVNKIYKKMEFSAELTKDFLENGSDLNITKTDYLNIKLMASTLQSMLSKVELNKKMVENAIANLIGLKYDEILHVKYNKQKILKQNSSLQKLIKDAYNLNPDLNSINLALKIKEEQIKEVNSKNQPMINLFGDVRRSYNSYEYGYLNKDNEDSWTIGVAVKFSLFDGFKTKKQILERKLDKRVVEEQKILLEEALALQLKNEFIKSSINFKQIEVLKEAISTASENSKVNFRGFKYELVKVEDLVKAQLLEVYINMDYLKYIHNYLLSLATIDKLVGAKINGKI